MIWLLGYRVIGLWLVFEYGLGRREFMLLCREKCEEMEDGWVVGEGRYVVEFRGREGDIEEGRVVRVV